MLIESLMHEHHMTMKDALTMPLTHAFLVFAAAAVRNGAVMSIPYEAEDRLEEARKAGKTYVLL